jgi:DNA primase large subunit
MPIEDLKQDKMMEHLLDALNQGQDIGHFGRLTFVMVARHYMDEDQLIEYLTKDPDCGETKARALIQQVESRGYNPPKRERVLDWDNKQDFPICPNPNDPDACNVYRNLEPPEEVYRDIQRYREQKVKS